MTSLGHGHVRRRGGADSSWLDYRWASGVVGVQLVVPVIETARLHRDASATVAGR